MTRNLLIISLVLTALVAFTQPGAAQIYLSEDFNATTGTGLPAGWDATDYQCTLADPASYIWKTNTGGYYPTGTSSAGQRCAYLYAYSSYLSYAALKTPQISVPANNDILLKFKMKNTTNGNLSIYVSTDSGATYLANQVAAGLVSINQYDDFEVPITGFRGRSIRIVFRVDMTQGATVTNYYRIDNVVVEKAPTCQPPTGLYINSLSASGADLYWSLKGAGYGALPDTFDIRLLDSRDSVLHQARIDALSAHYSFTGLAANTTYRAQVMSDCEADYNGASERVTYSFTTLTEAVPLPFAENFDLTPTLSDGWRGHGATINSNTAYAYGNAGRSLKLATTVDEDAYICTPMLDSRADSLEADFRIRRGSASYVVHYLAGYITDPSDFSTFVPIITDSLAEGADWADVRFNAAATADATRPVMVAIMARGGRAANIYVDNINVHALPSCLRPEHLALTGKTSTSATLTWAATNTGQILLRAISLTDSTVVTATATSSPYTLTGLTPNTQYTITAQDICSATDSSEQSLPLAIVTRCALPTTPVMTEDFDAVAASRTPECWQMGWINRGSSAAANPFTTSTAYKHGTSGQSMTLAKQAAGTVSYLASPCLPIDVAGRYDVELWVYRQSAASTPNECIEIWATAEPGDTVSGTKLGRVSHHHLSAPAEEASGWYPYEFNITVAGNIYITIVGHSENGAALCFDDFQVRPAPSCRKVSAITIDEVASTTATVSWAPAAGQTAWQVSYQVLSGYDVVADTTVVVTTPAYTITGLEPSTRYALTGTVSAVCSVTDTAQAVSFAYTLDTKCLPITRLPYFCGFEKDEINDDRYPLPYCWSRINDATSTSIGTQSQPFVSSCYIQSGEQALCHEQQSSVVYANNAIAVLPEIDTLIHPISSLRLTFYARASSALVPGTIVVGVISNPADPSTFVSIDTISPLTTVFEKYEFTFSNYTGTGKFIAWKYPKPSKGGVTVSIDEVVISENSVCPDIERAAAISEITDQSALITLTDTVVDYGWSYAIGLHGEHVSNMTAYDTVGSSIRLTGLQYNTQYDVYVRRNCGNGNYSNWNFPVVFTTTNPPANVPYFCGFEDENENSFWVITNSFGHNVFTIGNDSDAVYGGQKSLYVTSDTVSKIYNYDTYSVSNICATRTVNFANAVYQISYRWKCTGGADNNDGGRMVLYPTGADIDIKNGNFSYTGIYPDSCRFLNPLGKNGLNKTPGWNFYSDTVDLRGHAGTYNLSALWFNSKGLGEDEPLAIDDIRITEVTCIPPVAPIVSNVTSNSATLTYRSAGASQLELIVDTAPIDRESLPEHPLYRAIETGATTVLSALDVNTEYFYSIRDICAAGDTSSWLNVSSFRTACLPVNLPYVESFDNEGSFSCWTSLASNEGSVNRNNIRTHSGSTSIEIVRATAVMPELSVDSLANYCITGYAMALTDNVQFSIGVMLDREDGTSYEQIGNVTLRTKDIWTEFVVYFTLLNEDDYEDFRSARYIAIALGDNAIYLDDIKVDVIPQCPKPTEVAIDSITSGSFQISFTENGNAQQWAVRTGNDIHIINSNPATIAGLLPSTSYSVEIASICAPGDTSDFTHFGTITTECAPIHLPWTCGFESLDGFKPSTYFVDGLLESQCWNTLNVKLTNTYPYYLVSTSSAYIHSGNTGLCMATSSGVSRAGQIMILPEFADTLNNVEVSFWYKSSSIAATQRSLQLGYITDISADSTFSPLVELPLTTSWQRYSLSIDTAINIPVGARLAFLQQKPVSQTTTTATSQSYLDDISVNKIYPYAAPSAPIVSNITYNSANVTVSDPDSTHNAWEYIVIRNGVSPDSVVPMSVDSTMTFEINGLSSDANYQVLVRAVTGSGIHSAWAMAKFHTHFAPFNVTVDNPFLDSFEDAEKNVAYKGSYIVDGEINNYILKGYSNEYYLTNAEPRWQQCSHTGEMCVYFYLNRTSNSDGITMYRQFHLQAGRTYRIKMYFRALNFPTQAQIFIGQKPDHGEMALLNDEIITPCNSVTNNDYPRLEDYSQCWQEVSNYFTPDSTGNYFIAIRGLAVTPNSLGHLYLDDFSVMELTGCTATSIVVNDATENSAQIEIGAMQSNDSFDYCVINRQTGDTVITTTEVPNRIFTISNLVHSSDYTVNVRRNCGNGDYSEWSSANFSTRCAPFAVSESTPFHDSFENAVHNAVFTGCYDTEGANSMYSIFGYSNDDVNIYSHTGKSCLFFNAFRREKPDGLMLYKELLLEGGKTYDMSVYSRTTGDGAINRLFFGTSKSNLTELTNTTLVSCNSVSKASQDFSSCWQEMTASFTTSVTGIYYIAINATYVSGSNNVNAYFDDLTVAVQPACGAPVAAPSIVESTIATLTVTLPMGDRSQAEVEWSDSSANAALGTIETSTGVAMITGLNAEQTYSVRYRYICNDGDTSQWSPASTGTTTATNCFAPQNVRTVGILNSHHATITWGAAPDATIYEYELAEDSSVIISATTTADTIMFDSLAATATYTFRVRAYCGNDTTDWQNLSFSTTRETFTVPFVCDFENTEINAGWQMTDHVDVNGSNILVIDNDPAGVHSGTRALYETSDGHSFNYSNVNSAADAQILIELPTGNYHIDYDWKCNGSLGTAYGRVFLIPYSTTLSSTDFELLDRLVPSGGISVDRGMQMNLQADWTSFSSNFTIPETGVYRLVVTVSTKYNFQIAQPAFAIDNINITSLECSSLVGINVISVDESSAMVSVMKGSANAVYEYGLALSNNPDSVAQWISRTSSSVVDTINLYGLASHSNYTLFARRVCDSTNVSMPISASILTPAIAQTVPYYCGFEAESETEPWTVSQRTSGNRFVIDSGANNGGTQSLYVTDDGISNEYSANEVVWTYAYVPLALINGQHTLSYDWRCAGKATVAYMRVFLLPASTHIDDDVFFPGLTFYTLPAGAIALDGGNKLNLNPNWTNMQLTFNINRPGLYNLVVAWNNDVTSAAQPPAAIDNINLTRERCSKFNTADINYNSTENSINLTIAGVGSSMGVGYHFATSSAFTDTVAYGVTAPGVNSVNLTGLEPNTRYNARLWAVCDSGYTSAVTTVVMSTLCGTVRSYPYDEGFEAYSSGSSLRTVLDDNCWLTDRSNTSTYYYVSSTSSAVYSGTKALNIFNSTGNNTQVFGLPMMEAVNGKTISLRYQEYSARASATNSCRLQLGYLSSPNDASTFVQLDEAPQSPLYWSRYTATIQGVPDTARLAFRAVGNNNLYVDDIHFNSLVTATVDDTICSGAAYNRHGLSLAAGFLMAGDSTLTAEVISTTRGVADSLLTVRIHALADGSIVIYDTICAGSPYMQNGWTIARPQTRIYPRRTTTAGGCQSYDTLYLTVIPTSELRYDTICQGDVYTLGSQNITAAGTYTDIITTAFGCPDTVTVHLAVVDTAVATDAAICAGDVYQFEGQSYTQSGVYSIVTVGAHGCPVTKTLRLAVSSTDSVVNVTFCSGSQAQVADTVITTAGQYTLRRVNDAGCDIVYHITATVTPPVAGYATDYVCEGKPYWGYDLRGVTIAADTLFVTTSRTDDMCDSLTYVTITVSPTRYSHTYDTIQTGDSYTWHDNTYTQPGDYTVTLQDDLGCDSIVTLHLEVKDGLDNVCHTGSVRLVPNPARKGQAALLITAGVAEIVRVEIINSFGAVVSSTEPHSTPIDITAPVVAGVYHVRVVTRSGEVYVEKLIVE